MSSNLKGLSYYVRAVRAWEASFRVQAGSCTTHLGENPPTSKHRACQTTTYLGVVTTVHHAGPRHSAP